MSHQTSTNPEPTPKTIDIGPEDDQQLVLKLLGFLAQSDVLSSYHCYTSKNNNVEKHQITLTPKRGDQWAAIKVYPVQWQGFVSFVRNLVHYEVIEKYKWEREEYLFIKGWRTREVVA